MDREIRILGVSGSPRRGATSRALQVCMEAIAEIDGVHTHTIDLAGKTIHPCRNCNVCKTKNLPHCPVHQDDFTDEYMQLYRNCDGIVLASPVYLMNPTGLLSNFMSRMRPSGGQSARQSKEALRMGGSIAVGGRRNGGQETTIAALNLLLQAAGANVVGGDVLFYNGAAVFSQNQKDFTDETGLAEIRILGRKVAYLTMLMCAGQSALGHKIQGANLRGFVSPAQEKENLAMMGLSFLESPE